MSQADFGRYTECSINLAVALVNTYDPIDGGDALADLDGLTRFLESVEVTPSRKPTRADLDEVRALRTSLRSVFEASTDAEATTVLNELLAGSGARPELTSHDDGPFHLHYSPHGTPIAPRLAAEAAMALAVVMVEGGRERLHICDGDRCEDVFVDQSRNNSRRYCSPAVCGNRASVAAFRARQRAANKS